MTGKTTRDQIVEAADRLFYQRGYDHTSFADIADAVNIAKGNFYYHFKSKDEILEAVIAARLVNTKRMLDQWEAQGETPEARIKGFIHMLVGNRDKIVRFGCPVGTLCTELAKLGHVSRDEANALFGLFRTWLRRQFRAAGCCQNADTLATHLLARSQGAAALANAFHDESFIDREVEEMCDWLCTCLDKAGPAEPMTKS